MSWHQHPASNRSLTFCQSTRDRTSTPQPGPDVRFKGGSEPGVVALAWWLSRDDGRKFVVAGMLNDPDVNFNQLAAIDLISNAVDLI